MTKRLRASGSSSRWRWSPAGARPARRSARATQRACRGPRSGGRVRRAAQADPDNPRYRIALERAMQAPSRFHLDRARQFEQQDQLEAALGEQAGQRVRAEQPRVASKVALEKTVRDRAEAARPKPAGSNCANGRAPRLRADAESGVAPPLDLISTTSTSRTSSTSSPIASGINVSYDREVVDRPTTCSERRHGGAGAQPDDVDEHSGYKVVNERSIFVFPDTPGSTPSTTSR